MRDNQCTRMGRANVRDITNQGIFNGRHDESQVAKMPSTKVRDNSDGISFQLLLQFCESDIGGFSMDFIQGWKLKVSCGVINTGKKHCLEDGN